VRQPLHQQTPQRWIALLRGINVGGRTVPMAGLRTLCEGLGWREVETYIQSGNVCFAAAGGAPELEAALERALAGAFFPVPVIARDAAAWGGYLAANPFPEIAAAEPNRLMLALAKAPPAPDAVARLRERATAGERVERTGDALWLHYPAGAGTSKLAPGLLDRLVGAPVTTRNWRTVLELARRVAAPYPTV
jgi:uncharacterized protein (DUF1697 family)